MIHLIRSLKDEAALYIDRLRRASLYRPTSASSDDERHLREAVDVEVQSIVEEMLMVRRGEIRRHDLRTRRASIGNSHRLHKAGQLDLQLDRPVEVEVPEEAVVVIANGVKRRHDQPPTPPARRSWRRWWRCAGLLSSTRPAPQAAGACHEHPPRVREGARGRKPEGAMSVGR